MFVDAELRVAESASGLGGKPPRSPVIAPASPSRKDFDLFEILEGAIYCAAYDQNHTALIGLSQEYRALIRENEEWLKNA